MRLQHGSYTLLNGLKSRFNAAQGDFSDAPQLCSRCAVRGLNSKACHYRGQITGKVCGLDFCRELALRLRLLQAPLYGRFTAFSPIDHRLLYRFRVCTTCECPLNEKAAPRIAAHREEFRSAMNQAGYNFRQRRLSES